MGKRCPWYISVAAVEQYMEAKRVPVRSEGPEFDAAEEELMAIAIEAAGKKPRELKSGLLQYRSSGAGRKLRLRLLVSPKPRKEGKLPQLVHVLPSHDGLRRKR